MSISRCTWHGTISGSSTAVHARLCQSGVVHLSQKSAPYAPDTQRGSSSDRLVGAFARWHAATRPFSDFSTHLRNANSYSRSCLRTHESALHIGVGRSAAASLIGCRCGRDTRARLGRVRLAGSGSEQTRGAFERMISCHTPN